MRFRLFQTLCAASICAVLFCATSIALCAEPFENMFVINEDNSHFFDTRAPEDMTLDGLNAFVDQYADAKVTHLFLCATGDRANVANPAREAIWEPNALGMAPDHPWAKVWTKNCKLLHDRGIDPYKVWIARCREKNISPWISMRMNDVHFASDENNFMHSSFWFNNRDKWRIPNAPAGAWEDRALDYKYPEVRKYATDFIDFLFDTYDFDGLELDWMRFGYHLAPGEELKEAGRLMEVVAYARKLADEKGAKLGRKVYIAVRVPADPDAAVGLGMDAVAWAKAGLVDLIIPCPFFETTDFNIPIEVWRERLAGLDVALAPGAEGNVRAYPGARAQGCSLEQIRGFAASEKYRGTSNVYLFNWMDCDTRPVSQQEYVELLKTGFDAEFLAGVDREVPITFRDRVAAGISNDAQLPKTTDAPVAFKVAIGPKPTGEGNRFVVGLEPSDDVADAAFQAKLNGVDASEAREADFATIPGAGRAIEFIFPTSAFQDGANELTLDQTSDGAQTIVFVAARLNGSETR